MGIALDTALVVVQAMIEVEDTSTTLTESSNCDSHA